MLCTLDLLKSQVVIHVDVIEAITEYLYSSTKHGLLLLLVIAYSIIMLRFKHHSKKHVTGLRCMREQLSAISLLNFYIDSKPKFPLTSLPSLPCSKHCQMEGAAPSAPVKSYTLS